jgi:hypothetical protein
MVRAYAIGGPDLARLQLNRTHFPNIKVALGIQINFGDAAIVKPDGRGGAAVVGKISGRGAADAGLATPVRATPSLRHNTSVTFLS